MSWLIHRSFLLLYCISILVIKDCQSLFLRHTQTGKCIAQGSLISRNKYARRYWAEMVSNCLNVGAEFRYPDNTELLNNTKTGGTFASYYTSSFYRQRLFLYANAGLGKAFANSPDHNLKQRPSGSLYLYKVNSCAQPQPAGVYIDEKKNGCTDSTKQKFTFGAVTAYNSAMQYVHCSYKQKMNVKRADYGDFNQTGVFNIRASIDTECSAMSSCQVKLRCSGKSSCDLTVDTKILLPKFCSNPVASKEIYTEYTCEDNPSSITSTGENLRLDQVNEGYIEIKDGSTWIKVEEKNWDKNRQKMLCQHLGFNETDANEIRNGKSGINKDIATGDLICYKTQSSGISCCAGLEVSNTGNTDFGIPYVTCRSCVQPLLKDRASFPDSVFSGHATSGFEEARLSGRGWCTHGSENAYLTIDLQKEYHITQVMTMGDKDQTSWSDSYSLKYSHDIALVDGSSPEQITGNQNGYQASFTDVTIYNARYIKIESTKNLFCLRIELCGEVQTPAAVRKLTVTPSSFSALLSWEVPGKEVSSYITDYEISLNGPFLKRISRKMHENTYNITELIPNTHYKLLIQTRDGSQQYSKIVNENFETKNAGPVKPVPMSYSSLNLTIPKPLNYFNIQTVMVIVQVSPKSPTPSEEIRTADLKPYETDTQQPYITAYLKVDGNLRFEIGDGEEYNSNTERYFNQPLTQVTDYIVFLRFFNSTASVYSTEWSKSVQTLKKPPAPEIAFISTGSKKYTISWTQPKLSGKQTVLKYYYALLGGAFNMSNESNKPLSIPIDVEYDERYTFEVQVETDLGRSDKTIKSWFAHSVPLETPTKEKDGYKVILKKPKQEQNITTVSLVLLRLHSKSSKPTPPEELELIKSPSTGNEAENVAIIAKEFNVSVFKEDSLEISLRDSKVKRRRKREAEIVSVRLIQSSTYRTTQMNTDENGNRVWSYWSEPFTFTTSSADPEGQDGAGGATGAAVGATVGVILIVALVLAVIFFRRRRKRGRSSEKEIVSEKNFGEMLAVDDESKEEENVVKPDVQPVNGNDGIYSNETGYEDEKGNAPVPVAEFAHYVNELKANDNKEFKKEYEDLPKNMDTSWDVAKRPFNKKKNRYGNIVTYDHSRVVLSGDDKEDYINASYIDGMKPDSYIATQGPNKATVKDIWRMVWEQRCYSIVMVTSLVELGKPKCEKYWPDKGSVKYGEIEVTLMKTEEFAYHVTHTLQLKKDGEEREVRHYYFFSWPDHGVPKYPTQLLAFRKHYRTHHMEQSGPVVVHCSAGVGRTGVFIAIDTILEKFEQGVINSVDIFGEVSAMRERRMNMIQTTEQYIFVHEAILETILCGINEVDSTKIKKEVEKLSKVSARGMTGFQEKFKRLSEVSPKLSPDECTAGILDGNSKKNRNKSILPAECGRVPLQYLDGVEDSDYINAVFVHGYLGRNYFIATQSPLQNTINDFWRMVHSQKSSTIVLLNNVKDGTSFPKFWPANRGKPTQYESLTVQLDSETESNGIWTRKFILSPYPDLSDGHVVNIFQYTHWPDHRIPPRSNGVITLTSLVEKSRQSYGQGPVIVACSDGAGRTGTYIAISNLLERMKIEQAVDVFQAIKIIRGTRPQFVENAEQYQFCYTAMMAYLEAFSEYANFD